MPHECTNCGRVFADGSKEMLSGCPDCGGNKFQFKPAAATERAEPSDMPERTAESGGPDSTGAAGADSTGTSPDRSDASPNSPENRRDLSEGSKEWPDHGYGSTASSDPDDADASPDTSDPAASPADASGTGSEPAPTDPDATIDPEPAETPGSVTGSTADDSAEDPAQADARTDVVSPDEIAAATPEETDGTATPDAPGSPASHPDDPAADTADRPSEPRPDDRPDLDDLREELNEQFESIRIVAPGEYELNLMELYDRTEYIISLQEDGRYVIEVPDTWDTTPDPDET